MKQITLIFIVFSFITLCCNNKNISADRSVFSTFAGNWLSLNYRDSLDLYGTPAKVNTNLEEIIISYSVDSLCLNLEGVETPVFKIDSKKEKSFIVKKFNQDDFTEFTLSGNGQLSYYYKKYNQKSSFFRVEPKYAVKIINGWATAAQLYFNERIIAANYFLLKDAGGENSQVAFTSYGKITGLPVYSEYSICYQGDCRSMSDNDLITLSDGSTSDNFIYEWKKDTLRFYSVSNVALRDEMPRYVKAAEIFKFKKRM